MRAPVQGVGALAGFGFNILGSDLEGFRSRKALDRGSLGASRENLSPPRCTKPRADPGLGGLAASQRRGNPGGFGPANGESRAISVIFGGESGIRTHGTDTLHDGVFWFKRHPTFQSGTGWMGQRDRPSNRRSFLPPLREMVSEATSGAGSFAT